jgi:dTDP-4-dehydrorhamnose reductase
VRVLVLGAEGMLGHRVCRRLGDRLEVWATYFGDPARWQQYGNVPTARALGGVDAARFTTVEASIARAQPAAVLNCIGIVKQRDEAKMAVPTIRVNSLFPHLLADACEASGARLIHVSTDCVFSGARGPYAEADTPDPTDLYGRSKLLGEVDRDAALTLRTSIIGWEVMGNASLLEWFAAQRNRTIKGYRRVIYSGLSTAALADVMAYTLEEQPQLSGLYHVASRSLTKYDLLTRLRDALGWSDINVQSDDDEHSDRSLSAARFIAATGWQPPSWDGMTAGLAAEWPTYRGWRGLS